MPSPVGNWKQITVRELNEFIEKRMAPHITLKISVAVGEELICLMENQAREKDKLAGQMINPHNCLELVSEAKLWRAMAEKLKRACVEWHKKNPL